MVTLLVLDRNLVYSPSVPVQTENHLYHRGDGIYLKENAIVKENARVRQMYSNLQKKYNKELKANQGQSETIATLSVKINDLEQRLQLANQKIKELESKKVSKKDKKVAPEEKILPHKCMCKRRGSCSCKYLDQLLYEIQRLKMENETLSKERRMLRNELAALDKDRVCSLGALLDPELSLETQVAAVARSAFLQLQLFHQLRPYLDKQSLATVIHALVTSRLDYCNALYVGLPSKVVRILQLVQNRAARVLMGTGHYSHIMPVLFQLKSGPNSKALLQEPSLKEDFFDEIEDLKYALKEVIKLNTQYEKCMKELSSTYGITFSSMLTSGNHRVASYK
ncbi:hypothetical protein EYD10_08612 [Varanus komodoensis]|nr:hypothetical protein EYD10_08612 [Varanus komodoensis]